MHWDDMTELVRHDAEDALAVAEAIQPMLTVGGDEPWVMVWCRPADGDDFVLALDEMCAAGRAVGAWRAELHRSVWVRGGGRALLAARIEAVADGLVRGVDLHPFTRAVRGVRWGAPLSVPPEACRSADLGLLADAVCEGPHLCWPDAAESTEVLRGLAIRGHEVMVSGLFADIADITDAEDRPGPGG